MDLRQKMQQGRVLFGTHITNCDIQTVELIANCGFDYLWIDMEHTQSGKREVHDILLASRASRDGIATFVRIPSIDPVSAKPILEMGPTGIIFPGARSPEDAARAVSACCYPPKGERGFGPRACIRYGLDSMDAYVAGSDKGIWKLLQIETREAYLSLDAILQNMDIDAFILGPVDFAASFGHHRDWNHPQVLAVIDDVIKRVKRANRLVGVSIGATDAASIQLWIDKGVNMISSGSENSFIISGCKQVLSNMRQAVEGRTQR